MVEREKDKALKKKVTKKTTNMSSAGGSLSGSPRRKVSQMRAINTRKDSVRSGILGTPNALKSIVKKQYSRNFDSSVSRHETMLKINDEHDDNTLDREIGNLSGTNDFLIGHSKGFSINNTPQTSIIHDKETEELARVKRAYTKYSNNLQDWNSTISKMNMARSKNSNGRKIRSPIRSLVQLQDSYQCDHLPFKMKEHIEDELDNIDTTRTVQFVGD